MTAVATGWQIQVGDTAAIPSNQEKKIAALEARDGLACHYCHHPLSRNYKRCIAIDYHADFWYTPEDGDQRPGYYPQYEFFVLEGCKAIQIDHKLPRTQGGSNKLDNLVLSCPECNAEKSDRYSYEAFIAIKRGIRP